ncbi:MAG TPA: hypothetical protein VJP88_02685 [Caulobacteraceae bacterium]|nr:hypothetical protein [Caulobacteraceae bacterium]
MPRYYFDFDDGLLATRDEHGHECESLADVRRQALTALPAIVGDDPLDRDHSDFVVNVRDEDGRYVFRAVISVSAGWLSGRRP